MIAELGQFALALAFVVMLLQATLPMVGAARRDDRLIAVAKPVSFAAFLLVLVAFVSLTAGYVVNDFSIRNVAENSHSAQPLFYRLTGVWGNHEGSLLLWVLVLALFAMLVAHFGRNIPPALKARVVAVQGMIGIGFLAFILFTSNPFMRLDPVPADGAGVNPLLQDPGLAFHPPLLYLGYVGLSVAFSFAVAALIEGRVTPAWARWVRPWTLLAWIFLSGGIALGSWWAYYELGWGGWWFWDPVENASFMPWLAATALLHSAIVVEKRDALKSWTILLAIVAFSFSLMGTFLVRSGVLTSVHAFATDPARGLFILMFLVLVIGGSLGLYAWRAPQLRTGGIFAPVSREGALVVNNLLLATALGTVFLGTLYPLFLDALTGTKVSVGPPYFNATFVPLMAPLLLLIAVGPFMAWKRADLAGVLGRLKAAMIGVALIVVATAFLIEKTSALALFGIGLAAWIVLGSLSELADRLGLGRIAAGASLQRLGRMPRAAIGMTLAHLGVGLVVLGITASEAWQSEYSGILQPGEEVSLAGYTYRLRDVREVSGPNYAATRAKFEVFSGPAAGVSRTLTPEVRRYANPPMKTTEAAIRPTVLADLYAVLGESDGEGGWAVRIYHKPLVSWIWLGVLVMCAGGFVSLSDRRLRIGAPARRTKSASPAGLSAAE